MGILRKPGIDYYTILNARSIYSFVKAASLKN